MQDRFILTDTFIESVSNFDKGLKASLWKCLGLLCKNLSHPSLSTEKLNGVYSSRITIDYRLIHEPSMKLFRLLFAGKHEDAYRFANSYKKQIEAIVSEPEFSYRIEERLEIRSVKDGGVRYKKKAGLEWGNLFFIAKSIIQRLKKGKIDELLSYRAYSLRKLKRYFK
jgi:hypothetical protein